MLIPNEAMLDVLLFADFNTLVSGKFVDRRFKGVLTANERLLAIERRFHILVANSCITYDDVLNGGRRKSMHYEHANVQSFAAACRQLAGVIDQHVVVKLTSVDSMWIVRGVDDFFRLLPALESVHAVGLNSPTGRLRRHPLRGALRDGRAPP